MRDIFGALLVNRTIAAVPLRRIRSNPRRRAAPRFDPRAISTQPPRWVLTVAMEATRDSLRILLAIVRAEVVDRRSWFGPIVEIRAAHVSMVPPWRRVSRAAARDTQHHSCLLLPRSSVQIWHTGEHSDNSVFFSRQKREKSSDRFGLEIYYPIERELRYAEIKGNVFIVIDIDYPNKPQNRIQSSNQRHRRSVHGVTARGIIFIVD